MNKFYYFLILLLISSCTAEVETNEEEDNSATGVEIVFEQGLGENPTQFVANWNILVNEISEDEETLLYFSINPDEVQWTSTDQNILFYQFGLSENPQSNFILNVLVSNQIVEGVEFFSPAEDDESLNKEDRESVLTKIGLYDEVDNPVQMGGGVTINNVRYVIEPVVDKGILRGVNFYSTRVTN